MRIKKEEEKKANWSCVRSEVDKKTCKNGENKGGVEGGKW